MPFILRSCRPEEIAADALMQPDSNPTEILPRCFTFPPFPLPALHSHPAQPYDPLHPIFSGKKQSADADPVIKSAPFGKAIWELNPKSQQTILIHTFPQNPAASPYDLSSLCASYRESIRLAVALGCSSLAMPLLPLPVSPDKAAECAITQIGQTLLEIEADIQIALALPDHTLSSPLLLRLQSYLKETCTADSLYPVSRQFMLDEGPLLVQEDRASFAQTMDRLQQVLHEPKQETFQQMLLRLIDEQRLKDSAVYKRANLDRRLFSRIRSHADYQPSKNTVLALAIALKLDLETTCQFLNKAGFALSHSLQRDIIIEFFIQEKIYDIFQINEALFAFSLPLLGLTEHLASPADTDSSFPSL